MISQDYIRVHGKHCVGEATCPSRFVAAAFTIAKTRKQSEVSANPSADTGDACMYSETLFSHKKKEMLLLAACTGLRDILLSHLVKDLQRRSLVCFTVMNSTVQAQC